MMVNDITLQVRNAQWPRPRWRRRRAHPFPLAMPVTPLHSLLLSPQSPQGGTKPRLHGKSMGKSAGCAKLNQIWHVRWPILEPRPPKNIKPTCRQQIVFFLNMWPSKHETCDGDFCKISPDLRYMPLTEHRARFLKKNVAQNTNVNLA